MSTTKAFKVLKKAESFLQNEKPERAVALLKSYLGDHDNKDDVWRKLVRAYWMLGDELLAQAVLRHIVPKLPSPHMLEVIGAGIPYAKPLIIDEAKLIYYDIPKSGSSTIKRSILHAAGFYFPIWSAHATAGRSYKRFISFLAIDREYSGYESFAVLRHPVERLRSYWQTNVISRKQLVRTTGGRSSFYGLNTLPSYHEMLRNFSRYRQVFHNFRFHTESSLGFIGNRRDRIRHIFKFPDVDSAVALIERAFGAPAPRIHRLKSSSDDLDIEDPDLETRVVEDFYNEELAIYFSS